MKFFGRELYAQFNSPDASQADAADELWEKSIESYNRHLKTIRKELPDSAKRLSKLCLHDAELINPEAPFLATLPAIGLLGVAQRIGENLWRLYLIWYALHSKVRVLAPIPEWPFSSKEVNWLYDEFDISEAKSRQFVHRVLLSDGRIIVIPFTDVGIQPMTAHAASAAELMLQSA